jgi:hypothetical protein
MATLAQTNWNAVAATNGLHDIKPPVVIPSGWAWLWWTLAALAAVGLIIGVTAWFLSRRKQVPLPPLIPPHVRARQRLEAALRWLHEPKPFVIAVSDALRTYLEERFDFRAPERTTEEFLRELQATQLLNPAQKESLGDFLQRCDLVKFARYEPTEAELRDLHGAAGRLVNETEPHPLAAPGAHESAATVSS